MQNNRIKKDLLAFGIVSYFTKNLSDKTLCFLGGNRDVTIESGVFLDLSRRFSAKALAQKNAVQFPRTILLFFAVYEIYQKNYSFSRVKFLVFFQCKTANSFYSKINDSSRVRTTPFSSSRSGVRVSVVPNIFTNYP